MQQSSQKESVFLTKLPFLFVQITLIQVRAFEIVKPLNTCCFCDKRNVKFFVWFSILLYMVCNTAHIWPSALFETVSRTYLLKTASWDHVSVN